MEEVKKRWQDAQTSVKKKESERKRMATGTGGGPEPDIYFRNWELIVLDTLSPTAIVGIEGAVDTSCPMVPVNCGATNMVMPEDSEIDIEEKAVNVLPEVNIPSPEQFQENSSRPTKRKSVESLDLPNELIILKKRKLENDEIYRSKKIQLQELQLRTLMNIEQTLMNIEQTILKDQTISPPTLSPIIKFS